jgi:hypothetical protein
MDENKNNEVEDVLSSLEEQKIEEREPELKVMPDIKTLDHTIYSEDNIKEIPEPKFVFILVLSILVIVGAFLIWTFLK